MKVAMLAGLVVTLAAVCGLVSTEPDVQKRQQLNEASASYGCPTKDSCEQQLEGRAGRLRTLDQSLADSELRQRRLVDLMRLPAIERSLGARPELELESKAGDRIREERNALMVRFDHWRTIALFGVGAIVGCLVMWRLLKGAEALVKDGSRAAQPEDPLAPYAGWWCAWAATVLAVVGTALIGQYLTAVERDKTWFGFDSWEVSLPAWIWVKVGILGNQLIAGCTVALIACLTRWKPLVDISKPRAGVGPYVEFMRTWTALGFIVVLAFGCYWLTVALGDPRRNSTEKIAYALPAVGAAVPVAWLLWRVVRNMRELRENYEAKVRDAGDSHCRSTAEPEKAQERKPAPDPTSSFFNDKPWQIPSAVVALATAAWLLLDVLGVRQALLGQ
jgi:hypothetical protein